MTTRNIPDSAGSRSRDRAAGGFTLPELMVVLAVLAVVMTLAAPSFARIVSAAAVSTAVDQFMADMRFARSEAIRRGGGIVLCRSDDPESAVATCATAPASQGWATGWIVFHDVDGDSMRSVADTLLRVQARHTGLERIDADGTPTVFRFNAVGRLLPGSVSSLHFGGPDLGADIRRVVCVNPAGRARVAGDGSASCGSEG